MEQIKTFNIVGDQNLGNCIFEIFVIYKNNTIQKQKFRPEFIQIEYFVILKWKMTIY